MNWVLNKNKWVINYNQSKTLFLCSIAQCKAVEVVES